MGAGFEKIEFKVMLPNINLLYLFCGVLILADNTYISRFWTMFEAFLGMRKVTTNGLEPSPETERRYVIKCIHNATDTNMKNDIVASWRKKTTEKALGFLRSPDVMVTNQSDKDVQLKKLEELDAFAKSIMREATEA